VGVGGVSLGSGDIGILIDTHAWRAMELVIFITH